MVSIIQHKPNLVLTDESLQATVLTLLALSAVLLFTHDLTKILSQRGEETNKDKAERLSKGEICNFSCSPEAFVMLTSVGRRGNEEVSHDVIFSAGYLWQA